MYMPPCFVAAMCVLRSASVAQDTRDETSRFIGQVGLPDLILCTSANSMQVEYWVFPNKSIISNFSLYRLKGVLIHLRVYSRKICKLTHARRMMKLMR